MEEEKLLRVVIYFTVILVNAALTSHALAQDVTPLPESLEGVTEIERAAKEAARELSSNPMPLPDMSMLGDLDIPEWNDLLQSIPQLRDVLPLDGALDPEPGETGEPSELSEYGVVLVSFSMPDASLRQLSEQARTYGFSTVFRGLVNNSFADTLAKLQEVFDGDTENMPGVSIDPTAFVRFDVEAVPAFIFLKGPMDPCESQGCISDPAPEHDIVYGNVSFQYAAELVVRANGLGAGAAQTLLDQRVSENGQ